MPEYRVTSGKVRHGETYYRAGDTFEADLTERQVEAMEITPLNGDDDHGESGTASADAAEDDAEAETESDEESDDDDVPDPLTAEYVENAEYPDLRTLAGRYDDVNGNWGEDRLRTELLDKVEG